MPDSASSSDQINFGSDLSLTACMHNCAEGECCDCDNHPKSDTSGGQRTPVPGPYQHPSARESLQSVLSGGQGPSQPRPIIQQQPYQSREHMNYGSRGQGQYGTYSEYPRQGYGTGGVHIAGRLPSGFSTQASSYNQQEGANITARQQARGDFRDGAGQLWNSGGQPIDERGRVIQLAATSMPQSSPTSGISDESFQTARSHYSQSSGGGSHAGSDSGSHHSRKGHKNR